MSNSSKKTGQISSVDPIRIKAPGLGCLVRESGNRKIVILKLDHIGDFFIAMPAFRALRERFRDFELTLVCGRWNCEIARKSGLFQRVVGFNHFPQAPGESDAGEHIESLLAQLDDHYAIAIDMRVHADSRPVLEHLPAIVKCGIDAFRRYPFLDIALPTCNEGSLDPYVKNLLHERALDLLRIRRLKESLPKWAKTTIRSGIKGVASIFKTSQLRGSSLDFMSPRNANARMHISEHLVCLVTLIAQRLEVGTTGKDGFSEIQASDTYFSEEDKVIAIAPFSNSEMRQWPLENFVSLAEAIVKKTAWAIALLGTASERKRMEDAFPPNEKIVLLAGETDLVETASVLRRSSLFIGNNSGLAHMAAYLGVSTLAIFDGTHEVEEWGPRGPRVKTIAVGCSCRGCFLNDSSECIHSMSCVHQITPERVFEEAMHIIGEK